MALSGSGDPGPGGNVTECELAARMVASHHATGYSVCIGSDPDHHTATRTDDYRHHPHG